MAAERYTFYRTLTFFQWSSNEISTNTVQTRYPDTQNTPLGSVTVLHPFLSEYSGVVTGGGFKGCPPPPDFLFE